MSTTTASPIPAGWYPDPVETLQQRWWNGETWTSEIAPYSPSVNVVSAETPTPQVDSMRLPAYSKVSAYGAVQAMSAEPRPQEHNYLGTPGRDLPARQIPSVQFSSEQSRTTHTTALAEPEPPRPFAYVTTPPITAVTRQLLDRPTQRYTASIWLLTFVPLCYGVLSVLLSFGPVGLYSRFSQVSLLALAVTALFIFAIRDRQQLQFAGHESTASPAWLLLSPLAYLLARTVAVKRQTGQVSLGPVFLYILVVAAVVSWALLQPSSLIQIFAAAPM